MILIVKLSSKEFTSSQLKQFFWIRPILKGYSSSQEIKSIRSFCILDDLSYVKTQVFLLLRSCHRRSFQFSEWKFLQQASGPRYGFLIHFWQRKLSSYRKRNFVGVKKLKKFQWIFGNLKRKRGMKLVNFGKKKIPVSFQ